MGAFGVLVFAAKVVIGLMMLINLLQYAWAARGVRFGLCRAWARLRCWRRAGHEDPEVREPVAKLTAARRAYCGRRLMAAGRLSATVFGATFLVDGFHNEARVVASAGVIVVFSGAGCFPKRCFSERSLSWVHVLLMAHLCFLSASVDGATYSPFYLVSSTLLSFFIGGVYLWFPLYLVTNTCRVACVLLARLYLSPSGEEVHDVIVFEGFAWLFQIIIVYCVEALLDFGAMKEVEARFGQCQLSAVSSLLDLMCDAVLDLDAELLMKSHFPKLANMLVHGNGKSLCGQALSSLLGEGEDQRDFLAAVRGAQAQGAGTPGMFTVRLRDSMGNLVRVVLYHVPYRSVGGNTHHLLGVREDVDAWSNAHPAGAAILRPDIAIELLAAGTMQETVPPMRSNVSSRSRSRSASSRASSMASSRATKSNQYGEWLVPGKEMAVRIAVEAGLPVWSMGDALRAQLGVSGRAPVDLVEFLADEGMELFSWLKNAVDDVDNRRKPESFTLKFGELTLSSEREGAGDAVKGMAFVHFERPLPPQGEREFVIVGLSQGLRRPLPFGRGSSATAPPQALSLAGDPSRSMRL